VLTEWKDHPHLAIILEMILKPEQQAELRETKKWERIRGQDAITRDYIVDEERSAEEEKKLLARLKEAHAKMVEKRANANNVKEDVVLTEEEERALKALEEGDAAVDVNYLFAKTEEFITRVSRYKEQALRRQLTGVGAEKRGADAAQTEMTVNELNMADEVVVQELWDENADEERGVDELNLKLSALGKRQQGLVLKKARTILIGVIETDREGAAEFDFQAPDFNDVLSTMLKKNKMDLQHHEASATRRLETMTANRSDSMGSFMAKYSKEVIVYQRHHHCHYPKMYQRMFTASQQMLDRIGGSRYPVRVYTEAEAAQVLREAYICDNRARYQRSLAKKAGGGGGDRHAQKKNSGAAPHDGAPMHNVTGSPGVCYKFQACPRGGDCHFEHVRGGDGRTPATDKGNQVGAEQPRGRRTRRP
jgi:hypothetical protein